MRQQKSRMAINGRKSLGMAAAVAGAIALFTAAPARAGNELANAFEATFGHLLAYEAINLGHHVLTGGGWYGPPAARYYGPPVARYYAPPPPAYYYGGYGYGYGYGHGRPKYVVKHKYVYKNEHGHHGHGNHYGPPRYGYGYDDDRGHRGGHGRGGYGDGRGHHGGHGRGDGHRGHGGRW